MMTSNTRDALCILGHVYLEYQRCEEALAVLEGTFEFFPEDFQVGVLLARARLAAGDGRRALTLITQLLANPGSRRRELLLLLLKGRALATVGEQDLARHTFEAALPGQSGEIAA